MKNIVYLDTETTGFFADGGELLELAIVCDSGKVLFNELVQPITATTWPEAQAIHGISPEMVSDALTVEELRPIVADILKDKTIVIYNAAFDSAFLERYLKINLTGKTWCAMETFAAIYGDWNDYWGSYKWQKLTTASDYIGYKWPKESTAHRALADCQATRALWHWMTDYFLKSPQDKLDIWGKEKSENPTHEKGIF